MAVFPRAGLAASNGPVAALSDDATGLADGDIFVANALAAGAVDAFLAGAAAVPDLGCVVAEDPDSAVRLRIH